MRKIRFETTSNNSKISSSSGRETVSSELDDLMDGFEPNFKFKRSRIRPR